MTVINYLRPKF